MAANNNDIFYQDMVDHFDKISERHDEIMKYLILLENLDFSISAILLINSMPFVLCDDKEKYIEFCERIYRFGEEFKEWKAKKEE